MTTAIKLCAICEAEPVTATNPDTDFCRICFYTGAHIVRALTEDDDSGLLDRIRLTDGVLSAEVWHTGGGCFNLAVRLADGRLLTPSRGFREDPGQVWPEPGIPEAEKGERWSMVVSEDEEAWHGWDEDRLAIPQALWTDDGLVRAVAALAGGADVAAVERAHAERGEDGEGDLSEAAWKTAGTESAAVDPLREAIEGRATEDQLKATKAVWFKEEWSDLDSGSFGPIYLDLGGGFGNLVPFRKGDNPGGVLEGGQAEWLSASLARALAEHLGVEVIWT